MNAQEFAEQGGGFADCLLNIYAANTQGIPIDFSEWGESVAPLLTIEKESLETLLDLYRDLHGAKVRQGTMAAQAAGVRIGMPKKPLPKGFQEAAQQWFSGKLTAQEAADSIGMSRSTFYRNCREMASKETKSEALDALCAQWRAGEIATEDACEALGMSASQFTKVLRAKGLRTKDMPDSLYRARKLFQEGTLSKKEAACMCRISVSRFEQCLALLEESRNREQTDAHMHREKQV